MENYKKRIVRIAHKRAHFALSAGSLFVGLAVTASVFGAGTKAAIAPEEIEELLDSSPSETVQENSFVQYGIPEIPIGGWRVVEHYNVTVTGYSSTYDQTNEDPFTTASGESVRWGIVAVSRDLFQELCASSFSRCEREGIGIRLPRLFGDEVFLIKDLMNRRKTRQVDIWFPTRQQAQRFGIGYNEYIEIVQKIK